MTTRSDPALADPLNASAAPARRAARAARGVQSGYDVAAKLEKDFPEERFWSPTDERGVRYRWTRLWFEWREDAA
jgi:hypothetical protein